MPTIEERKQKVLEVIKNFEPRIKEAIIRNMEQGLCCACGKTLIPYFGEQENEHGFKLENGVSHGYDDCAPLEK